MEQQLQVLEKKVVELIGKEPDLFLVDIRIKPTNNIKVYVDGDQGISIDSLVKYNRALYRQIAAEGFFPNNAFCVEVSSSRLD